MEGGGRSSCRQIIKDFFFNLFKQPKTIVGKKTRGLGISSFTSAHWTLHCSSSALSIQVTGFFISAYTFPTKLCSVKQFQTGSWPWQQIKTFFNCMKHHVSFQKVNKIIGALSVEDITRTTQQLSGITTHTQGTHTCKSPITHMSQKSTCTKGRTVYSS